MENSEEAEGQGGGAQANQLELLKSYLAFGRRAIRSRRLMAVLIFIGMTVLTVGGLALWPRTYQCELRLIVQRSQVLDPDEKSNPLESASDLITRHDNLVAIVDQLDLVSDWERFRPPLMGFKDKLMEKVRGKPDPKAVKDALVNMLESHLWAKTENNSLTIGADWSHAETSRRIVEAAKDTFLQARHTAEISVIEEKMSILDGHATRLRAEIDSIAQELKRMKDEKIAAATKAAKQVGEAAAASNAVAASPTSMAIRSLSTRATAAAARADEDLPAVKDELEAKKRKLSELQARRSQGLADAKSHLVDLELRLTPEHPEVRAAEQRVALLNQETGEETALKAEVSALEARVKATSATARSEGGGGSGRSASSAGGSASNGATEALPSEILKLLDDKGEIDPVIGAQLSTAMYKYSELRNEIRTARITLDEAQAAFTYRYKISSPAVTPLKPTKPKVPVVAAGGIIGGLLLALLIPILLELKTGIIVERWQVAAIPVPLLAELKLPPHDH
jgi:uncharacterized protein involved in exopolysaccharide biosynthesis